MKIYTKTGDKGTTGLRGGKRVSKSDLRIQTYGSVDEINSVLGIILSDKFDEDLRIIGINGYRLCHFSVYLVQVHK